MKSKNRPSDPDTKALASTGHGGGGMAPSPSSEQSLQRPNSASALSEADRVRIEADFLGNVQAILERAMSAGLGGQRAWGMVCQAFLNATGGSELIDGRSSPEEGLIDLLTAEGGCVPVAEAVLLWGKRNPITPRAMHGLIRAGKVIACRVRGGPYRVPVWQFQPAGGLIEGLPAVLHRLCELSPGTGALTPFAFLLQENPLTGGDTPLNALRAGRLEEVLEAAEAHGG